MSLLRVDGKTGLLRHWLPAMIADICTGQVHRVRLPAPGADDRLHLRGVAVPDLARCLHPRVLEDRLIEVFVRGVRVDVDHLRPQVAPVPEHDHRERHPVLDVVRGPRRPEDRGHRFCDPGFLPEPDQHRIHHIL